MKYEDKIRQIYKEPGFNKWTKKYWEWTPPKCKIKIFLDKNLPEEIIDVFRELKDTFKIIGIGTDREEDKVIFNKAKKQNALIITRDIGFWDDKKFPLKDSPGILIVRGKTISDIDYAIGLFLAHIDIIEAIRKIPDWAKHMRWKVSSSGYVQKILTYDGKVEVENIKY